MKHGTRTSYVYWKCRCPDCIQANRDYQNARNHRTGRSSPPACPECGTLIDGKVHAYCEEHRHGHAGTYGRGCRCKACTKANAQTGLQQAHQRYRRQPPPDSHGHPSTYVNWGCRCELCKQAAADSNRRYREASREKLRAYKREWYRRQKERAS